MEEPDWYKILRSFYEENLSFEYGGEPEYTDSFKPDREDLEGIDFPDVVSDLKQAGLLEVKTEKVNHGQGTAEQSVTFIRLSEKGYEVVFEHDSRELQREFQKRQTTRQNQVNAAIGYLTLGLLTVTTLDLAATWAEGTTTYSEFVPHIVAAGVIATMIIGSLIYSFGLLQPTADGP